MAAVPDLVHRHAEPLVDEALEDTRVVLVNGARQAGKSTLTRMTAGSRPGTVIRLLDDPATLRAAHDDPAGFVDHDALMVIDEIQLAPELLRAIKVTVDLDPRPERRPGPVHRRRFPARRWDRAFIGAAPTRLPGPDRRWRLPRAVRRAPRRRAAFFDSYLSTLIERDVLELASIERRGDLFKLLTLLAGRAGGLLVPAALAGQSGIPRTTLVRYLQLLSAVFLIKTIPAWASGQTRRAVGTPKLAFVDTGIACHLIGQDAVRLGEPGGAGGAMLENFAVMELARQLTWSGERGRLYHYRTKDQIEVDAVIETPDGRVIAAEVKAGATVRTEDLAGLRNLASHLGDKFVAGYVLYTGQQTLPFGGKIKAVPMDALWHVSP